MSEKSSKRPLDATLLPLTILLVEPDASLQTNIARSTRADVHNESYGTVESLMANSALLAFMHDLVSQSPLSTATAQSREKLLYEHLHDLERRFREGELEFDDEQVHALQRTNGYLLYRNEALSEAAVPRAKPFNFVPSGTRELFLDWPARRDAIKRYGVPTKNKVYEVCVPRDHSNWLAEKISLNRVPFELDLYDPPTYFSIQAAAMRLLRRNLQVQLFGDRDWSSLQLSNYMDNSALASQCKPTYTPQDCLLSWLQTTYANVPRGDAALHIAQQRLFASDSASRVARWLVFMTLERLESGSLGNADEINSQAGEIERAQGFVSVAARVYALLASVPPIEKRTAVEYRLLTALESKQSRVHFDRRLYTDYKEWRKQDTVIDRRVFIAAEALRWNLFFFGGWDMRAIEEMSLERLVNALESIYKCLPENRLVIDADVLRRYAAHNVELLLNQVDTTADISQLDERACNTGPSLHSYASILSAAGQRAERLHQHDAGAKEKAVEQKLEKVEESPAAPSGAEQTEKHEGRYRRTGGWLSEPHERFDMQEPLEIQRILWAMRDTVNKAEDATPSEKKVWLDGLYVIYSGTYSKSLRELTNSWLELHSLLQLLLPPHDVPASSWSSWQQTIRSLYNGSEVPTSTEEVLKATDIPMPYMNEEQFHKDL